MNYDEVLEQKIKSWKESGDFLELAAFLKDHHTIGQSLITLRKIIKQPIHNIMDVALWSYFGGRMSDDEFRAYILKLWAMPDRERFAWMYDIIDKQKQTPD
jgi:hypothetical protein